MILTGSRVYYKMAKDRKLVLSCKEEQKIEKAYLEGKIDFWKPISCHLYPIRLVEQNGFIHIMYHEWSVCVPAKRKGEKEGIPLYKFLKVPLIRRFGEDWYERFVKQLGMNK